MWNLPYQPLLTSPDSWGGQPPASLTASAYWLRTMRRSSSSQRTSALPDRSIAPPDDQYRGHHEDAAAATASAGGAGSGPSGENRNAAPSRVPWPLST